RLEPPVEPRRTDVRSAPTLDHFLLARCRGSIGRRIKKLTKRVLNNMATDGMSKTSVAQRWISVALIGLAAYSAGISKATEAVPSDWRTYENQVLGISLRHPPSMSVHTGEDAAYQGFIPWGPRPD